MINKWTIAGVGFVAALLFTAYNSARITNKFCDAKISTLQKKHAEEALQIQQITIEQLDKNVKIKTKQSKFIANDSDHFATEWLRVFREKRAEYNSKQ